MPDMDKQIELKHYSIVRYWGQRYDPARSECQYLLRLPRLLSDSQMELLLRLCMEFVPIRYMPRDNCEMANWEG